VLCTWPDGHGRDDSSRGGRSKCCSLRRL
jgi:hypothetical protein